MLNPRRSSGRYAGGSQGDVVILPPQGHPMNTTPDTDKSSYTLQHGDTEASIFTYDFVREPPNRLLVLV